MSPPGFAMAVAAAVVVALASVMAVDNFYSSRGKRNGRTGRAERRRRERRGERRGGAGGVMCAI